MSTYRKIVRQAYLGKPSRLIGLVLCIGFGMGIWGAMDMAFRSIPYTLEGLYRQTRFADLEVRFLADDRDNLPDLSRIEGVGAVEYRLLLPGTIQSPGRPPLTSLLILTDGSRVAVDDLMIREGRPFAPGTAEVVVERSLAQYHGYRTGDAIRFQIGEKVVDATISGVAVSPEFFSMSSNPDFSIPEKGTLGVGYGNLSVFNRALGFTLVNDVVISLRPGARLEAVRSRVLASLSGLAIDKVMTRDDQFSHQQIMFNLAGYKSNGWALIVALILLSFFIAFLTFDRVIVELRKDVGNLAALGYSRREIVRGWLGSSALLGLGGGVVACTVAVLQRMAIAESFGSILGLPFIHYVISPTTVLVCLTGALMIALGASLPPMLRLLAVTPRAMLTPAVNVSHYPRGVLRVMNVVLGRLSMASRYGIRNLFRRPGLAVASVLLIGFAVSVALAYALCTTSFNRSMFLGLEQERWDVAVDFTHPVFEEDAGALARQPGVLASSPYFRGFVEAEANGRVIDTRVLGMEPAAGMRTTDVIAGRPLRPDDLQGVVVAKDVARDLGLRVGDRFTSHYQDVREQLQVVGISGDLNMRQLTMNRRTAQRLCGFTDRATGVYLKIAAGSTLPPPPSNVAKVSTYAQMRSSLKSVWDDALLMVYVTTGFCNAMVIIFLAMFIMLAVSERDVEYATLLSVGYGRPAIRRIVLSETLAQVVLATVIAFPMGVALTAFLNYRLSQSFFQVRFFTRPLDFVQAPAVALAVAVGVAWVAARGVSRRAIAPRLRSRDIG